jgi:hypothetical protein
MSRLERATSEESQLDRASDRPDHRQVKRDAMRQASMIAG